MTPTEITAGSGFTETDPGLAPGFDQMLDEATGSSAATGTKEAEPAEEAEPEPEVTELEPEAEPESPEPPAEEATEQEDTEFRASRNGKGYVVPRERLNNLIAANKALEEIREIAPTVNHVKTWREGATMFRRMEADFIEGGPEDFNAFVDFWSGGAAGDNPALLAKMQAGFTKLAEAIPERLQRVNPQAYQGLQDRFIGEQTEALYQRAAETGDKQDLYRAQMFDWAKTGAYREAGQLPKADPLAARKRELDLQEKAITERAQKEHDRQWGNIHNQIQQDRRNATEAILDKVLEPAKGRFSDVQLESFRKAVRADLEEALKSDSPWSWDDQVDLRAIESAARQAFKGGTAARLGPQVKAYNDAYLAKARPIIERAASKLVGSATASKIAEGKANRDKLASSQKKGGGAPGAPAARAATKPPTSHSEAFDAAFEAAFAPSRR